MRQTEKPYTPTKTVTLCWMVVRDNPIARVHVADVAGTALYRGVMSRSQMMRPLPKDAVLFRTRAGAIGFSSGESLRKRYYVESSWSQKTRKWVLAICTCYGVGDSDSVFTERRSPFYGDHRATKKAAVRAYLKRDEDQIAQLERKLRKARAKLGAKREALESQL